MIRKIFRLTKKLSTKVGSHCIWHTLWFLGSFSVKSMGFSLIWGIGSSGLSWFLGFPLYWDKNWLKLRLNFQEILFNEIPDQLKWRLMTNWRPHKCRVFTTRVTPVEWTLRALPVRELPSIRASDSLSVLFGDICKQINIIFNEIWQKVRETLT